MLQESDPTNESRIFDLIGMVKGITGRNRDHCQEEAEVILSSIHDDMSENVDERRRVQHEDLRRSLRDHRMCILVNVSVCVLAESSATSVHETMLRPALVRGFAGGRRGGDVRLEGPRERGTHPRIHHAGATARRAHVIPARPAKGNRAERQSLRARRKKEGDDPLAHPPDRRMPSEPVRGPVGGDK